LNIERRIKMPFDYSKLRGRIVEKYKNQSIFSKRLGISERSLSLKLNGKIAWKQSEIMATIELLELSKQDIQTYFFEEKVQNI